MFSAATVTDLITDINAATKAGGSNTIVLAANTTFDLTAVNNTTNGANGLPVIAKKDNLTISGQGGDIIERDTAAPAFRLFDVSSGGSLTLNNLTLQNGLAFGSGSSAEGGAIYNQGSLSLNSVTVQSNRAQGTGGVIRNGKSDNGQDAAGGGIWSSGTLALASGTVIQNNQAVGGSAYIWWYSGAGGNGGNAFGGGLCIAGGTANVTGAILNSNTAQGGQGGTGGAGGPGGNGSGGALYVAGAPVLLTSDILENNSTAGGQGGTAITSSGFQFNGPGGLGGNALGGALAVTGGPVTLTSDIVESNSAWGGAGGQGSPNGAPGTGFGGGLYLDGAATITLGGDTVELNTASSYNYGYPGPGEGGGIWITPKTTVYFDPFTLTNNINNTDRSGTNGTTANIDGSYVLQP
jgi:hypothetical protein